MSIRRICAALLALFALNLSVETAAQETQVSPYSSAIRYDAQGRVVGTIAPDPDGAGALKYAATRTFYDISGLVVRVETGELASWQPTTVAPPSWPGFTVLKTEHFAYDTMNRKVRSWITGPSGAIESLVQTNSDRSGRPACTAVRMNPTASLPASACTLGTVPAGFGSDRITRNIYDPAGQLLKIQKGYGTALQEDYATYTYSANGKQTSLTDARGYKAAMTWDGFDRQARWYFPSPTATGIASTTDYEEYGYDANGNRTSLKKRDGLTIGYQYDALNRNTVKTIPERSGLSPTHTRDIYSGYDLAGRQLYTRFDGAGGEGVINAYDGFGRLTSSALTMDGVTRTLTYQWDKNGNRVELGWPDGQKTSYAHDGLNRMKTLFEGALGSTTNMVGYTYDNRGLRATQAGRYEQYTGFSYDGIGRLYSLTHNFVGTAGDVQFTYGYSPASQMISQTRNDSNNAYAWTGLVNGDDVYATNGLNQYTSVDANPYVYDANGNLTSDGVTSYSYDIENRLVAAGGATLRYDPLGRLYETVSGAATTRFLYDGNELVAEYNAAGAVLNRYAHSQNVDDPVVWYEGSGLSSPRWLHTNHQGSIIAVTDGTGAVIARNAYDDFGIPMSSAPGKRVYGRFGYTGQTWIPEIGLWHYKARFYSPMLGRFLQTDPIGYEDQANLYVYVGNDPVNFADPTGTEGEGVLDSVGDWFWENIGASLESNIARIPSDLESLPGHIMNDTTGLPPSVSGGLSMAGRMVGKLPALTRSAPKRAKEIHSALDPIAQTRRTTAVLDTTGGRFVAGGGRDLTAAQRAMLKPGEVAAKAPGAHAEVTALRQATAAGAKPRSLAASRPICSACAAEIRASGGKLTSPTTATWASTWQSIWSRLGW